MGANASEGFHRRAAAAAMVGMNIVGVVCVLCNVFLAGRHWPPENRSARPSISNFDFKPYQFLRTMIGIWREAFSFGGKTKSIGNNEQIDPKYHWYEMVTTTSRSSIENTPDFFGLSDFSDTCQIFDRGIVDVSSVSLHTRIFGNHST